MPNKLSELTGDTNNNLSLIRITLALFVLLSHSFAMVTGDEKTQPFYSSLKITPGTMAVDMFFVISGFLLTQSLLKKQDPIDFIIARAARIYPALICATLFTALIIGSTFTSLPIMDYLKDHATLEYIIKTSTIIRGIGFTLPEVFKNIPLYNQVNGSLWSLPFELKMYGFIFITWFVLYKTSKMPLFTSAIILITTTSGAIYCNTFIGKGTDLKLPHLIYFFFVGSLYYCGQSKITISHKIALAAAVILLSSTANQNLFILTWMICAPYLLMYLTFIPKGKLLAYNKVGDYSYGVYVFAWPIQQSIIQINSGISILQHIVLSTLCTLLIAIPCFHYIEAPTMKSRRLIVAGVKSAFSKMRNA